jgi:hypothetical protein
VHVEAFDATPVAIISVYESEGDLPLAADPDVAARRPLPAGTFAVAIPATAPPTTAEGSVPIDAIVPIVFDMAPMLIAVTMTMLMAMLVTVTMPGKCRRRNEQSGGNCRH